MLQQQNILFIHFDAHFFKKFFLQVIQNCDELFDREELSAVPDVGWPDCFNSGVFVFKPSNETYVNLRNFAAEQGSFDGILHNHLHYQILPILKTTVITRDFPTGIWKLS